VYWATCNLDEPGTFAETPESYGMLYQWNRTVPFPATGDIDNWDSSYPEGNTWEKENDPSPAGWRVPTADEKNSLIDAKKVSRKKTTINGVDGISFTDLSSEESIFFPATGFREQDGTLAYVGTVVHCWTDRKPNVLFPTIITLLAEINNGGVAGAIIAGNSGH
jgi:hypothetical protein